jgi:hypothetical protein
MPRGHIIVQGCVTTCPELTVWGYPLVYDLPMPLTLVSVSPEVRLPFKLAYQRPGARGVIHTP